MGAGAGTQVGPVLAPASFAQVSPDGATLATVGDRDTRLGGVLVAHKTMCRPCDDQSKRLRPKQSTRTDSYKLWICPLAGNVWPTR